MRQVFIIAGPTGVGKSYLMQCLLEQFPADFEFPRLYTTRLPRENEHAFDREFISPEVFATMRDKGQFFWSEQSYGNSYGYTREAVAPGEKHIAINAYPSMLPCFETVPGVIMVGLNVAPEHLDLLIRRIKRRGESAATLAKRLEHIEVDVRNMQQQQELVKHLGKMFDIVDDNSLRAVMAWIQNRYIKENEHE